MYQGVDPYSSITEARNLTTHYKRKTMTKLKGLEANKLRNALTVKYGTPEVPIIWPKLGTPQTGNVKFDGPHGKYRFNVELDPESAEAEQVITRVKQAHQQAKELVSQWAEVNFKTVDVFKSAPVHIQTTKNEAGEKEATGRLELKLSEPAKKVNKDGSLRDNYFLVVDANGNRLSKSQLDAMGNGTKVRIALDMTPYYVDGVAGLSLKAKKIVVTEYQAFGQGINDDDYFDSELTGSFVASSSDDDEYGLDIDGDGEDDVNGDF